VTANSLRLLGFASALAFYLCSGAPACALSSKTKADEEAGALLFRKQDCAHCHTMNGLGGKKGPELTNLNKDKVWTAEEITNQILNGGQKMPPFSDALTDQQIAQLVAYLRAKHRPILPPGAPPAPTAPAN
jgi:mono/diheme cytochrome c family protein